MIRIAILGSTGSIGMSALEVIRRHPGVFRVVALTANSAASDLLEQVSEFHPDLAVLADGDLSAGFSPTPAGTDTEWCFGDEAVLDAARLPAADVVLNALVGSAGLGATLAALMAGKRLALANKESLVAGGPLVMDAVETGGGELIPIDSEHSAILQCLAGSRPEEVRRMMLTASGGPFRGLPRGELTEVGPEHALRHPTWSMGAKISIDSATLANKALEVVEAHFLYGLSYELIDAVIHPQSIIHSFVEFRDGSVMAQLGDPTMELPILFALNYPHRVEDPVLQTFDPVRWSTLTFEEIDHDTFRLFGLGVEAGRMGGSGPAVFNAANEVVVQAFLEERLGFLAMAEVVDATMNQLGAGRVECLEDVMAWDRKAREVAEDEVGRQGVMMRRDNN